MTPDEFWLATPRELRLHAEVYASRLKWDITLSWSLAAWMRAKRLPNLESLLRKIDHPAPPTAKEVQDTKDAAEEGAALLEMARQAKRAKQS